jgi:phosphatidylglycerol:prolipoprotein diacylglycerol transferase
VGHPTHPLWVHPAPLYETVLGLLFAYWIGKFPLNETTTGKPTGSFLIAFGLLRFTLEYFRADRLVWLENLNLSASQTISLIIVMAGGLTLLWSTRQKATPISNT